MIDKRKLLTTRRLSEAIESGQRPSIGIDVAINAAKGLRLIARVQAGLWEKTLRFNREIRLKPQFPFLDLPLIASNGSLRMEEVFKLNEEDASILNQCFRAASAVAVDAPRGLAPGSTRRSCENCWPS